MHVTKARVRYGETDQAGVAYHASYLSWYEIGRTELLRDLGMAYAEFERERDLLLTVTDTRLVFHRPARYDELIRIETWVSDLRRVRLCFQHRLLRDDTGELLCAGHLWLACVTREGRARPLPEDLQRLLENHHEAGKIAAARSVGP